MIRPDLSDTAFLRRHQNPLGFAVRGVAFCLLSISLWAHWPAIALLAVLVEAANWLYCPEHDAPPEWVEQIIDAEFVLTSLEPLPLRIGAASLGLFGLALYALGLWARHGTTILTGAALFCVTAALFWWIGRR